MPYVAIEQNETSIQEQLFFNTHEIAQLYEIAQLGAHGAGLSLRCFLGITSDIRLKCLSLLPLQVMLERLNIYYPNHIGFHQRFFGDINGEIFTFFHEQHALFIIEKMLGGKKRWFWNKLNRVEISVLSELTNILSNAFWRSLAEKTSLNWWVNPPTYVHHLSKTINNLAKVHSTDPYLIHFDYHIPVLGSRIQLVILPSQHTIKKLLQRINHCKAHSSSLTLL